MKFGIDCVSHLANLLCQIKMCGKNHARAERLLFMTVNLIVLVVFYLLQHVIEVCEPSCAII